MAVEIEIKKGDEATSQKDHLTALNHYTQALKSNPQAFIALLKRSSSYLKLKNFDKAKEDISTAFTIAQERGKRNDIGLCYYKLSLVYYAEKKFKLALGQMEKAKEFNCVEKGVELWLDKLKYEVKTHPEEEESEDEEEIREEEEVDGEIYTTAAATASATTAPPVPDTAKSTNIDVINKLAPLNIKIRDDWYQSNEEVIITIYAKNVPSDKLQVNFTSKSVSISFPSSSNSEYNYNLDPLFAEINPETSSFKVYSTKLEIYLKKTTPDKWHGLESQAQEVEDSTEYPSSSKKKVDWNKFKVNEEDIDKEDPQGFFGQLFKGVDDDTKRAMMKSYIQSNGTVLTTSWDEAKDKEFETYPPDGMEAKKWGA
ncbi:Protein SGT1 [Spathaspora sp. JA1]|nr:Protein SGT1 [Spathaspora sp. JA1]